MGHVPPPMPPWMLTIDQQIATLEGDLPYRRSRWSWRRRRAHAACARLIVLREHDLFGLHTVTHSGQLKPPPKPLKAATPTHRLT